MNKKVTLLLALCMLFSISIYSQEKVEVEALEEVVITDSRFKLKRENSGKTVIKISKAEIELNLGRTLAELINTKSGIEINGSRSNAGQNLGVFVRGGRNRQVLVIIDGVQVSDPSQINGEYDLRLLSLGNIESIEIIKGAASTLYGSGAATAVINITTKKASSNVIKATITSQIGTNQSQSDQNFDIADFNNGVNINGSLDNKFNYKAAFNHKFSNGLSAAIADNAETDAFSRYSLDLSLGYNFSDAFSLNIFGNLTDINSDIDGGSFFDVLGDEFNSEQYRVGISTKYSYNNGSVNLNASYSKYETEFISSFPFATASENFILDIYNKYKFNQTFYTIVGLNIINNQAEFNEGENFSIIDPYLNAVYVSDFGLNINAGARLNNHSAYGANFTYNFNPSYTYKFVDKTYAKVFGSYSTSFITPSLTQLFGAFGPNPNLNPEENLTIEAGIEFKLANKFRASVLYFDREEEDVILFDFTTGYFNATQDVNTSGLEFEISLEPIEKLSVNANYTYINNEEDAGVLIPENKVNLSVAYQFTKHTFASLSGQFTDDRLANDFREFPATLVTLDSFTLINLNFGHSLTNEKIKFFASIDNLFNENYQDVFGFTTKGANVRVGLQLNLL